MDVQLLLEQVNQISRKYDEIYRNTGGYFNIFSIAHIETDEVRVCRVIKELIDPKGVHFQGECYLRLFLKYALGLKEEFNDDELRRTVVEREKMTANGRRIDLFIHIPGQMSIPIEVKINAGDQNAQCRDYYEYARNAPIYYLTLHGYDASEDSLQDLPKDNIKNISFSKEILIWLSECLKLPETVRIASIREVILQFMDVLRKLTGQMEDKMEKEILEVILQSEERFKNAELIANMVKQADEVLFDWIFKALNKRIWNKYSQRFLPFDEDDDPGTEYDKWGIYYLVKKYDNGKALHLDLSCMVNNSRHMDDSIRAGFTIYDKNDVWLKCGAHVSQQDIMSGDWEDDTYWIAWEYLGNDTLAEIPNFRNHNNAFYSLLDKDGFAAFIDAAMHTIDGLMDSLKA